MSNPISYVNYDFDQIVQQLQNRLKSKESWRDIYRSSTGEMLIELLAYVLNLGMFYTERRAEESYILTAKNRSSIINLVQLLNYQPKRKTSATGNLTFSIALPLTNIVYIPKYTECQSVSGIKYLVNENVAVEKGQTSVSVKCIQGELVRIDIASDGSVEQEYLVNDTFVENSADASNPTFRIIIDGVEWSKVDSFIASTNVSKHYRVINEPEGTVTVVFGDNINGLAPERESTITIQYIKSAGLDGNVTYADKITQINSTIYDESGSSVTVTVTNPGSFLGGDAEEDIEEIRYEAPRVFKTGQRAVNRNDFIAILENYPGVANVNVWGENEEIEISGDPADYEMLNKVKMCIILQEWELPDDTFKSTLSEFVYNKSMLTVKYEFITPVFLYVIPTLVVRVTSGYSMSQTQADIVEGVEKLFKLGSTTKLGTMMKYSEVISAIHDLSSVAYTNMILEIKKELSESDDSFIDYEAELEAVDILPESVRLFVDGSYITKDEDDEDGTGSFSDAGGYIISGDINYSTGVLTLNIDGDPSSVFVRYQQNKNGNIEPTFRQICKLEETDITSIQMES